MKAVLVPRFGAPDVLEYREIERPAPPPGGILVRVAATGASFGDVMLRKGDYPDPPPFPFIPGFEACGTVEAVGAGVEKREWLGRRVIVCAPSCNAEYVACPAAFAAPVADGVSDSAAAAAAMSYLTGWYLLHPLAAVKKGQVVVVYAAGGGVGSGLVELAKLAGATVIAFASTERKCALARTKGADHTILVNTPEAAAQVRSLTKDRGADLILNSVGGASLARDFSMLAQFGQVVLYGMAGGLPSVETLPAFLAHFKDSLALRLFSFSAVATSDPGSVSRGLREIALLLDQKKITPAIHAILPLSRTAEAHTLIESGTVTGKIVLEP